MTGTLCYYIIKYIIKVNNQKLKDYSEEGHGAKSRAIKYAKTLDQKDHVEVVRKKWYMGASYVGELVSKDVVWSNQ